MKLIPDWKRAWRFASVQAAVLLALLSFLQAQILPLFQFAFDPKVWPWVTAGFGSAIAVLRVWQQSTPPSPQAPAPQAPTLPPPPQEPRP